MANELSPEIFEAISEAADIVGSRKVAFITGAGISTDSGIPDYRGAGAPKRSPMDITAFLENEEARKRYWAGGHAGWSAFAATQPNAAHAAVADLERLGHSVGVVTQNVDGLHLKAGSQRVAELHGTSRRVACTQCGQIFDRRSISAEMEQTNPWLASAEVAELGPDGDVIPERVNEFIVPACSVCGGVLRPDIVFFGEFIPRDRFAAAEGIIADAEAIIVAGTSLVVNSPIRLLDRARRRDLPIIIVNRGTTKWDAQATLKIDAGTGVVLPAIAARLEELA